jgi:hypothetical protein
VSMLPTSMSVATNDFRLLSIDLSLPVQRTQDAGDVTAESVSSTTGP